MCVWEGGEGTAEAFTLVMGFTEGECVVGGEGVNRRSFTSDGRCHDPAPTCTAMLAWALSGPTDSSSVGSRKLRRSHNWKPTPPGGSTAQIQPKRGTPTSRGEGKDTSSWLLFKHTQHTTASGSTLTVGDSSREHSAQGRLGSTAIHRTGLEEVICTWGAFVAGAMRSKMRMNLYPVPATNAFGLSGAVGERGEWRWSWGRLVR